MKFTTIHHRSSGNQINANCRCGQNSEAPKNQRQEPQRPEELEEIQRFPVDILKRRYLRVTKDLLISKVGHNLKNHSIDY